MRCSALVLMLAAETGCSRAPESPGDVLAASGLAYTPEAFIERVEGGDTAAVDAFLAAGMSPGTRTPDGRTAVAIAAHNGHASIVAALVARGADPNQRDAAGHYPLIRALQARNVEAAKVLVDHGAELSVLDDKWSPLMIAAFRGDRALVQSMLERGADVNAANERGMTPLLFAASSGRAEVVKALAAKGARLNVLEAGGHTALMIAANNGHADSVRALLDLGADAAVASRSGGNALAYARLNGHRDIAAMLQLSKTEPSAARAAPDRDASETLSAEDKELFMRAARTAWQYGAQHYRPSTGFIAAVPFYDYATVWDLASGLAMLYGARELGFIDQGTYKARMKTALRSLQRLALFDHAAFNKDYRVSTGSMVDRHRRPSSTGFGWSVTDIGRFLIWLKIVAERDAEFVATATAIARRVNVARVIDDGNLWGEEIATHGEHARYVEGVLGYEQYAAQGFALWGARAEKALSLTEHGMPIDIMGHQVVADIRQGDRLTSEPFVLLGLELGFGPEMQQLARAVLDVQRERARRTGIVTIVSEDAIDQPPHYFYYYCVLANARQFSIDVQDPRAAVNAPRWVSTKAAFAWHALFPSAYTRQAVDTVHPASTPGGWGSGVFEQTTTSTGTLNVNTEAGVMTAAVYALYGEPMLARSRTMRKTSDKDRVR